MKVSNQLWLEIQRAISEGRLCHVLVSQGSLIRRLVPVLQQEPFGDQVFGYWASCTKLDTPDYVFLPPADGSSLIVVADCREMCLQYQRVQLTSIEHRDLVAGTTAILINHSQLELDGTLCVIEDKHGGFASRMRLADFLQLYKWAVLIQLEMDDT